MYGGIVKKSEKKKIDRMVKHAFQDAIQSVPVGDTLPTPEFKLSKPTGYDESFRHAPNIFPYVAASLALCLLLPPLLWKDKPSLSQYVSHAYERGQLDSYGDFIRLAMIQGGKAL